ncbi:MAG: glycosyltransferase, partial [Methylotenera sp.]|nr:glycosyltransferase [Methylotenera sp.]
MTNTNLSSQVNVLLSTYNGEAYLLEQLQSLYQQTYLNVKVVVRDDGSSDSTLNLLKKEASDAKLVFQSPEANIGPAASFFRLLETSGDAGFYAFCDQDDIWVPNKIEVAVEAIKKTSSEIPVMYFSRLVFVDSTNQFIKLSALPRSIGFGNALVENIATGCTVVLNKAARDLVVKSMPSQCL